MAETEAILLKRFSGSGDAQALAEIIRRHAGLVYGAALRILADVDRASDVAQETFLQLTKDAAGVTGSLPGWLHRVATHKAIDRLRRDASRRHREREYAARQGEQASEWKRISPYVDAGLRELEPELRHVLILHFLEGRTTREIALLQGTSQATVSRRIGAGVEQLRAKLRRRGVLVAVGALSALLGDNAVQAAPLPLLTELGKMAMVGGAASAGAAGAGSGLAALASSALTALKAKAVVVAAVAVIGVGSAMTCYELAGSSSQPATAAPAASIPAQREPVAVDLPVASAPGLLPPSNLPQAETPTEPWRATGHPATRGNETSVGAPLVMDFLGSRAGPMSIGVVGFDTMMVGMGFAGELPKDMRPQQPEATAPVRGSPGPGRESGANASDDPNLHDPNDPGRPSHACQRSCPACGPWTSPSPSGR